MLLAVGCAGGAHDVAVEGGAPVPAADAAHSTPGETAAPVTVDAAPVLDIPTPPAPAGSRSQRPLASGWRFFLSDTLTGAEAPGFDDGAWTAVSVPHTWDSVRAVAKHTNAWYRTRFAVSPAEAAERVYVLFEGAFQIADVYVNGQHLGQHRGGYTRFLFDATAAVKAGSDNLLAVKVSSGDCADCLPDGNTRLWKGYGGLYRKAWLLTTRRHHVATTDSASSGVYATTSKIGATSASLELRILISNDDPAAATLAVHADVIDAAGATVLGLQGEVTVPPASTMPVVLAGTVANPKLWSPAAPALYRVHTTVASDGAVEDAVDETIGFRTFALSATDFTVNGVSTKLRGIGKHQETEAHASAVTDAELTADWDGLRELGVNFARLVHYPHAQLEYQLADERGVVVWAENGHTNGGSLSANADNLVREMVFQNFNHPSIAFWSAGNEASGTAATARYASVIHQADPSRPVVYASNGQRPANIDFTFTNTYGGWYGGSAYDFLGLGSHWVSETGAGMVMTTHTADAFATNHTVNSYEPEEYGALVNEVRFDDLFRHPDHVVAFAGWVFRDIGDRKYKGVLNSKGLTTFAGYKKDAFFHLESLLRRTPVVHLVAPHYFLRDASGGRGAVKVYSNAAAVTLTINGAAKGTLANDQYKHPNGTPIRNVFYWPDALQPGRNVVTASDGQGTTDTMTIYLRAAGAMPAEGARVTGLTSSNGPAYFIDIPVADQWPFYFDFDGTADNTFDVVPPRLAGAGWIATRRQSDPARTTGLAFDVPAGAEVFVMFTGSAAAAPSWLGAAGFSDTGVSGRWRDNDLALVPYALFEKTVPAGGHVTLAGSPLDYLVLVK
jgi:beta-galactosidase